MIQFTNQVKYAAIFVLIIFVIVSFIIISGSRQADQQNEETVTLTAFDKSILGTRLDPAQLKKQHIHADFAVFVNDQQVDFNDEKYFVKSVFMHTESDDDGSGGKKLHMHSTNVPLWVFFESVGMEFPGSRFYVNGAETGDYRNYVFRDGDQLLISVNSSDITKEIDAVTSYAKN